MAASGSPEGHAELLQEGASLFVTTREGGRKEFDPWESGPVYKQAPLPGVPGDGAATLQAPGAPPSSLGPDDDDVGHLVNWLQSMQTRKQPNATVNSTSHNAEERPDSRPVSAVIVSFAYVALPAGVA